MEFTTTVFESGYKVKDIRVEGYVCKTNVPSNTAFRATGHPQGALIMEDIIFQVANRLNISSDKVNVFNIIYDDIDPYFA
jgi:CO/xanthine dehydrogenase Mo-binding subunit